MATPSRNFVLGYDPGGNGRHGLVILEVANHRGLWLGSRVTLLEECRDGNDVIGRAGKCIGKGTLLASGVDTLTAWSGNPAGWRCADKWLRNQKNWAAVHRSIKSPNSLRGSMIVGGNLLLLWLAQRPDRG